MSECVGLYRAIAIGKAVQNVAKSDIENWSYDRAEREVRAKAERLGLTDIVVWRDAPIEEDVIDPDTGEVIDTRFSYVVRANGYRSTGDVQQAE